MEKPNCGVTSISQRMRSTLFFVTIDRFDTILKLNIYTFHPLYAACIILKILLVIIFKYSRY